MSNITVYYDSILEDATSVTASGVLPNSSTAYLHDSRLSFKFATENEFSKIQIDQPPGDEKPFQFLTLMNHSFLEGGSVDVYTDFQQDRSTRTLVGSATITSADPFILDLGSTFGDTYIDVELTGSTIGAGFSLGEMHLGTSFTSPIRPAIGITTRYLPRRSFIDMPNGERQSIVHGGVSREKTYTIPGMTLAEAATWADLFVLNAGSQLVILTDDVGAQYPCLMNQEVSFDDQVKIVSLGLTFTEVVLT